MSIEHLKTAEQHLRGAAAHLELDAFELMGPADSVTERRVRSALADVILKLAVLVMREAELRTEQTKQ